MRRPSSSHLALAVLSLLAIGGRPGWADSTTEEETREGVAFFEKAVRPVLVGRCLSCHGGKGETGAKARKPMIKGGLSLTSRAALLAGGDSGPAARPSQPEESLLIHAIRYHDEPRMPPDRRLSEVEIQDLTRWIQIGLPWPEEIVGRHDGKAEVAAQASVEASPTGWPKTGGRDHWAFRPVVEPPIPPVRDRAWPLGPIDRFVLAALDRVGLEPTEPSDRRAWIRRATFDLTGLPPALDEIAAFVADDSPAAYDRVVDRLLASPRYGERWGRHWLDLVRYADTAGETADYPVPEAYLYRNYVINAFNIDLPYDTFLVEQLAGDILARGSAERHDERIVATGFLSVARRFGFDPQNYHHLTIEDTIDTLGKSVLGLTLACARCHDHKFDPITGPDYYALYGIFASSRYPFPGGEETKRPRDFVPLAANGALAYAMAESDHPADARLQRRGDPKNLGSMVSRGIPAALARPGEPSVTISRGSGRRELAGWLTDPKNPLTARVLVNRVWQHHFGRGIVATPSDFGTRGRPPSHPHLLDWLAARLVGDGWSLKALHRRIMLSRAYRMASLRHESAATPPPYVLRREKAVTADPDNAWLAHFNRRRLDAESLRDTILHLGGDLQQGPGGPHPFPPVERWTFSQHAPFQAVYESRRRSVYLMTQRIRRHPFLALFDGADTNSSTPARNVTTVPTQALFFLNNPEVHRQAVNLAGRLLRNLPDDPGRLDLAWELSLARLPSVRERSETLAYLAGCRSDLAGEGSPPEEANRQAWASVVRTLFASNEFLYVD